MSKKEGEKPPIQLNSLNEDFINLIHKITKKIGREVKFIGHEKGRPDGSETDIYEIHYPKHESFFLFRLDRFGGEIFTTWDGDWYCLSKNHSSFPNFHFKDFVRSWQIHSDFVRRERARKRAEKRSNRQNAVAG
jgi:hypothetical protein